MKIPIAAGVVITIVCVIFGSLFGSDLITPNTKRPTRTPSTSSPTKKPTSPTSVAPSVSPTSGECTTYYYPAAGVGQEVLVEPSPGTFASMEFYSANDEFLLAAVAFNYLDGQVNAYFTVPLDRPPPLPTQYEFRYSTSNTANTSFPIVVPVPPATAEFESGWLNPDGCTPLPCTQTLYLFGIVAYCPGATSSPTAPTAPTNSPTTPE